MSCSIPAGNRWNSQVRLICVLCSVASVVSSFLQPYGLQQARCPCLSPTPGASSSFIELVMPSSHLILCHPLLLLPSKNPSGSFPVSKFFAPGGQSIGVSASASVLPSNQYSGLISFRMDWLNPLAIQRTLKSPLQHHDVKALPSFRSNSHIYAWLLEKL